MREILLTVVLGNKETKVSPNYSRKFYQLAFGKMTAQSFKTAQAALSGIVTGFRKTGNKLQRDNKMETNPADTATFHFIVNEKQDKADTNPVLVQDIEVNFSMIEKMLGLAADINYIKPRTGGGREAEVLDLNTLFDGFVQPSEVDA